MVVQDWGGPIGLGTLAAAPERFARVVASNTVLHTSDPALAGQADLGQPRGPATAGWCSRSPSSTTCSTASGLRSSMPSTFLYSPSGPLAPRCSPPTTPRSPTRRSRAGLRQMTESHPAHPQRPGAGIGRATMQALEHGSARFSPPSPTATPPRGDGRRCSRSRSPGRRAGRIAPSAGAGHFVQEEKGEELGSDRRRLHRGVHARVVVTRSAIGPGSR